VLTTMAVSEHKGWRIESRSYETAGRRWCPRALVSIFDGGRFCTHDVRALLSVTFETAQDADDYAVRMAKVWIEEREYRPLRPGAVMAGFARPSRSSRDSSGTVPTVA
jgi:hypothetical protein